MQLGDVGIVRQNLAQRVEHEHAGGRLVFAPLQRRDRRAVTVIARAKGGAPLRYLQRQLALLRAQIVHDIGRRGRRQQRSHRGDAKRDRERPAQTRGVQMSARLLLEYLDAAGVTLGDVGADGDRGGMKAGDRLHIAHRDLTRGGRDHRGDALGAAFNRRAAAEHGLAGVPRRQAIDLGAHDALEEIRRPRREFERTKQETRGLEHDLDPASLQHRREAGRGKRAIRERDPRRQIVRLYRLDRESALVVFDQPDHARRHHAVETGDDRGGHATRPGAKDRADGFKLLHPGKALCGTALPSEALRQDNTR